jgi:two-component system nitrate/nitrite response regulator NarL
MVRIIIVGPVRLYREALASALEACEGVAIVGLAGSGAEGLAQVYEHQPEVVLLDPTLPEAPCLVRHIRSLPFSLYILALATDGETQILDGLEQGIVGFVPSTSSIGDLLEAIDSVRRDELFYPPHLAGLLARRVAALGAHHSPEAVRVLTEREREILTLIRLGCSNKEAARHLGIEVATVKTHVHNLLAKLGVHRRGQAAAGGI